MVAIINNSPISPYLHGDWEIKVSIGTLYKDWFSRRDIINDDVNVIRELLEVCENLKSVNVLNECDVDFIIESLCIN